MTTFAQSERAQLADLFDDLGPQAPTLCEGWNTGDLAAHLLMRESDPVGAVSMGIGRLEGFTRKRMDAFLADGSWTQVVERVRRGSRVIGAIPGMDSAMNSAEYFIHHEDVRRAGDAPAEPRLLLVDHERLLWRQVALQARLMLRKAPTGVVVENALEPDEPLRVKTGSRTVTLVGKPSEILLWLAGRREVAEVDIIGDPDDVQDDFWAVSPASG